MALSVSPAIKVFALLGVMVALVMGGGMFVLGGSQEAVSAPLPDPATLVKNKKAAEKARTQRQQPAAKKATKKKEEKKRTTATPTAPAKKKPATRRAAPRIDKNGLPVAISRALATHGVVVVSLYGGGWKIDPMARDEAAAGARAAGAGFVALDVTRASSAAEALMLKYDTIFRSPAVLIFRGGGDLALQLDGFRDRDTVAQAAHNARP